MDDNNWDIGAIIRSYNNNRPNNVESQNLLVEPLNIENDECDSIDRLLATEVTNFDCLDELFSTNFSVAHQKKSDDQSSGIINPTTSATIIVDQVKIMDQNNVRKLLQPIPSAQLSQQIFFPPPLPAITCALAEVAAPQKWNDLQQQLVVQENAHPTLTFPMRDHPIQIYKKKNQSMKFVYELMKEELTDDPWAWRKYGQKAIKGSPFLRNCYRCSTSKSCQAKKQIEKSPKAENLFSVAYCDEHNHPPPTKRCFIAGCNACSKSKFPKGINIVPKELSLTSSPSSSKLSKRSRVVASPISPAMPTLGFESAAAEKGEDKEERGFLIPNKSVNEDIFMSFEELQVVAGSI